MKNVKIIKAVLVVAALPLLAGAATQRYVVELSTEPAARFAARSFGERRQSLARPEVQAHRRRIRSEQDAAISGMNRVGGRIVLRTDTTSNTIVVDLEEADAAKLSAIP